MGGEEGYLEKYSNVLRSQVDEWNSSYTGDDAFHQLISNHPDFDTNPEKAMETMARTAIQKQHVFSIVVDLLTLVFVATSSTQLGMDFTLLADSSAVNRAATVLTAFQSLMVALIPIIVISDADDTVTRFISQFVFSGHEHVEGKLDNLFDSNISSRVRISWKTIMIIVCCVGGLAIGILTQKGIEDEQKKMKAKLTKAGYSRTETVDVYKGHMERYSQFQLAS